jgi:hypothetical protein
MSKESYVPLILIALFLLGATPNPTDVVVVVVDTSGSMMPVVPELKRAIKGFIGNLPLKTQVSVVSFDVFSTIEAVRQLTTDADVAAINATVDRLQFRGAKTNLDEGMKGAQAALWQSLSKHATHEAVIVLFSDGISDPSAEKRVVDLTRLAKAVFPPESGTDVYLIGVSEEPVKGSKPAAYLSDGNITQLGISESQLAEVLASIRRKGGDLESVVTAQTRPADLKTKNLPKAPTPDETTADVNWLLLGLIPFGSVCGYLIGRKARGRRSLEVAVTTDQPLNDEFGASPLFSADSQYVIRLQPGISTSIGCDDFVEHSIPALPGRWSLTYKPGRLTLNKEENHVPKISDYQSWQ